MSPSQSESLPHSHQASWPAKRNRTAVSKSIAAVVSSGAFSTGGADGPGSCSERNGVACEGMACGALEARSESERTGRLVPSKMASAGIGVKALRRRRRKGRLARRP